MSSAPAPTPDDPFRQMMAEEMAADPGFATRVANDDAALSGLAKLHGPAGSDVASKVHYYDGDSNFKAEHGHLYLNRAYPYALLMDDNGVGSEHVKVLRGGVPFVAVSIIGGSVAHCHVAWFPSEIHAIIVAHLNKFDPIRMES